MHVHVYDVRTLQRNQRKNRAMSMLRKLEETKATLAANLAQAEREYALFQEFAATVSDRVVASVRHVHDFKPFPWVSLQEQANLGAALDLVLELGMLHTVDARKAGCVSVQPIGHHGERYENGEQYREPVPMAIILRQHIGHGFASAELSVYTVSGYRVAVPFPYHTLHQDVRDRISFTNVGWGRTRTDRTHAGVAGANWMIKFGSADSIDSLRVFNGPGHLRVLSVINGEG